MSTVRPALTRKALCWLLLALMGAGCASTGHGAMASPADMQEAPLLSSWPASLWSTKYSLFDQTPDIAIHASGEVIFKQRAGWESQPRFYRILLTQEQQAGLKQRLKALESLKGYSNPAHIVCTPGKVIRWQNERGVLQAVAVEGPLDSAHAANVRAKTPPEFLSVYDEIIRLKAENAVPYEPESIRVSFVPIREGVEYPIPWAPSWAPPVPESAEFADKGYLRADVSGLRFEDLYNWIESRVGENEYVTFQGKGYYTFIEDVVPDRQAMRTTLPPEGCSPR
ncbi:MULTISPECIES: hypothetical protein [Corallococcus]|uniref:hypothetical protein n=1 Tax=Corallococcus TaxID=83461 RepID=UPI000F869095|nr:MULTISPECIES: hypothetical protein [Corallococcus]NPC48811.1 hypothetical protein [Corallococcus exiguus]